MTTAWAQTQGCTMYTKLRGLQDWCRVNCRPQQCLCMSLQCMPPHSYLVVCWGMHPTVLCRPNKHQLQHCCCVVLVALLQAAADVTKLVVAVWLASSAAGGAVTASKTLLCRLASPLHLGYAAHTLTLFEHAHLIPNLTCQSTLTCLERVACVGQSCKASTACACSNDPCWLATPQPGLCLKAFNSSVPSSHVCHVPCIPSRGLHLDTTDPGHCCCVLDITGALSCLLLPCPSVQ